MRIKLPSVEDLPNLKGKKVLIRLDLNVPIQHGVIVDDYRIQKALPTLRLLIERGAKIIILSHIDEKEGSSLEPVARHLFSLFPRLRFENNLFREDIVKVADDLLPGEMILFENIRSWSGEEKNDPEFVDHLVSLADIYVNEAFSVSHRPHASIVGVPKFLSSFAGVQFLEEVNRLSEAFLPPHPFLFVLGGAKFETKYPLIEKFLNLADSVFIGGAIANSFFKTKGYFLGDSVVSEEEVPIDMVNDQKIILPIDVRTQHKAIRYNKKPNEVGVHEKIWDIGEKSSKMVKTLAEDASLIVWNGPMGNLEQGWKDGSIEVAKAITSSNATTIVGGGDTISCIKDTPYFKKFSFVSTGGGAMLDFLAHETLPGIEALKNSSASKSPKILQTEEEKGWLSKLFS